MNVTLKICEDVYFKINLCVPIWIRVMILCTLRFDTKAILRSVTTLSYISIAMLMIRFERKDVGTVYMCVSARWKEGLRW